MDVIGQPCVHLQIRGHLSHCRASWYHRMQVWFALAIRQVCLAGTTASTSKLAPVSTFAPARPQVHVLPLELRLAMSAQPQRAECSGWIWSEKHRRYFRTNGFSEDGLTITLEWDPPIHMLPSRTTRYVTPLRSHKQLFRLTWLKARSLQYIVNATASAPRIFVHRGL